MLKYTSILSNILLYTPHSPQNRLQSFCPVSPWLFQCQRARQKYAAELTVACCLSLFKPAEFWENVAKKGRLHSQSITVLPCFICFVYFLRWLQMILLLVIQHQQPEMSTPLKPQYQGIKFCSYNYFPYFLLRVFFYFLFFSLHSPQHWNQEVVFFWENHPFTFLSCLMWK